MRDRRGTLGVSLTCTSRIGPGWDKAKAVRYLQSGPLSVPNREMHGSAPALECSKHSCDASRDSCVITDA